MSKITENLFRPQYRNLSSEEQALLVSIKEKAQELVDLFPLVEGQAGSRETSLAITKLEEAIMWVVKGITK